MTQLALLAAGTLASEDLTCIAAGVLIAQGKLGFLPGVLACFMGILAGDALLFACGRLAGTSAARWPFLSRMLPPSRIEEASSWLSQRGAAVVFLSRFTPGLRLPVYFCAGLLKTDARRFLLLFAAACAVWTPLLVGAAALFGESALLPLFGSERQGSHAFVAGFSGACAALWAARCAVRRVDLRRLRGRLRRFVRWEFWPPYLTYLPLIPYLLYLAVRYRSLTLFTLSNPGIPGGGLTRESKSAILERLRPSGCVPEFTVIAAQVPFGEQVRHALGFMESHGLAFPVVLKPNIGERGRDVAVIRSLTQLQDYLWSAAGDTIIQRHVEGLEFGVLYCRMPGDAKGRIVSVTEKRMPQVTGDGRRTVRDLILDDERAACAAEAYERANAFRLDSIPAAGERIPLVEIGSHCRGAVFLDGCHLVTADLEAAIDRIARCHEGFHLGRFDLRAESSAELQQGRGLSVLELNGVAGEPAHIYDPCIGIRRAYGILFAHWKTAFDIGKANREGGRSPMRTRELIGLLARGRAAIPPKKA